ncbi:MAG TPA: sensor histidine kinase [Hyphomonadaceae bacterium]|nr:sensor histidine kinase [Hyphomonadaceae bacterium]
MATTTSLLRKLSTIFSSKPQSSPKAAGAPAATADVKAPKRISLRFLLLLIFAVALSPVLVIGGVRWSGDIERETQRRRETMLLVAEQSASKADAVLQSAPTFLNVVAAMIGPEPCARDTLSRAVDLLPQFTAMAVIKDGQVKCSSVEGGVGISVTDRDWYRDLMAGGEYAQSAANYGTVSKTWMMTTARRLPGAEIITLATPVDSMVYRLDRKDLPTDSEVALMDKSGRVFGSRHWAMLGGVVGPVLAKGEGGFFQEKSDLGQDRDVAIVPLSGAKFFAVLSAPRLAPIAIENVSAFGNFALPLLAWLLALVTAWLATDRLVLRWLDYLRRIAGLYASGKLSVQPVRAKRAAPGEINVLADTLEEMAVRVRDRTSRLEAALVARDAAMKEIHHRVKNNLQIINSLLSLQSRKVSDPAAIAALDDARGRINALSLIHRSLYEHNDIRSVDVKTFLSDLAGQLNDALGAEDQKIRIESDIDADTIDADVAVPLALFTAEAVTNAVKHAFPAGMKAKEGRVLVSYRVKPEEAILCIEDDGIGGEEASLANATGLGATLMTAFAKQVHGQLEEERVRTGGRLLRIRIPRVNGVTGAHPGQVQMPVAAK